MAMTGSHARTTAMAGAEPARRTSNAHAEGLWYGALYGPATWGVAAAAVAMPAVAAGVGSDGPPVMWILIGYAAGLAVSAALAARVADTAGVPVVLLAAAMLLAAGAWVCLFAPTLPMLVAGRIVLACGSGAALAAAMVMAATAPERRRPAVLAALGAVLAACAAVATLIAVAAQMLWWRLPLVLPAMSLVPLFGCLGYAVRAPRTRRPVDTVGALLAATAAGGVLLLLSARDLTLPQPATVTVAVCASAVIAVLVRRTRRRPDGFVPPAVVTDPVVARALVVGAGMYCGLFAVLAVAPLRLAGEHGWSVPAIGAALLPGAVLGAGLSRAIAGRHRASAVLPAAVGGFTVALVVAGLVGGPLPLVVAAASGLAVSAAAQVVLTARIAARVPASSRGSAAGLLMLAEFTGGAIGTAVVTAASDTFGQAAVAVVAAAPAVSAALAIHRNQARPHSTTA